MCAVVLLSTPRFFLCRCYLRKVHEKSSDAFPLLLLSLLFLYFYYCRITVVFAVQ